MPRRSLESGWYHICNRGFEKQTIFHDTHDFERFLTVLHRLDSQEEFEEVEVFAWCLIGNHFHLILSNPDGKIMSVFLSHLQNAYAKYYNKRYARKGPVFDVKFLSVPLYTLRSYAKPHASFPVIYITPFQGLVYWGV